MAVGKIQNVRLWILVTMLVTLTHEAISDGRQELEGRFGVKATAMIVSPGT